jgi:hypothetical protein
MTGIQLDARLPAVRRPVTNDISQALVPRHLNTQIA